MSNSSMVSYTKISPHKNPRKNAEYNPSGKITKLTIHHMAGNLSLETCGSVFQTREASANYGIDSNGKVGMYVPEDTVPGPRPAGRTITRRSPLRWQTMGTLPPTGTSATRH